MATSPARSSEPRMSPSALAHRTPGTRIFSGVWHQACFCLRPFAHALHADVLSASPLSSGLQPGSQPPRTLPIWRHASPVRDALSILAPFYFLLHTDPFLRLQGPSLAWGPAEAQNLILYSFLYMETPCLVNPTVCASGPAAPKSICTQSTGPGCIWYVLCPPLAGRDSAFLPTRLFWQAPGRPCLFRSGRQEAALARRVGNCSAHCALNSKRGGGRSDAESRCLSFSLLHAPCLDFPK